MERLKHTDVLRRHLSMSGARIADVGCGNGAMVRFLNRHGAQAVGVEPSAGQLARARAEQPAGDETYVQALGEALPFTAGAFDCVAFSNALHHVPVDRQAAALAEAARVLATGGLLYVQEPVAAGAYFELLRPVEDETEVRAKAYQALQAAAQTGGLVEQTEFHYEAPIGHGSFAAMAAAVIAVDERRRPRVEAHRARLEREFLSTADLRDGTYWFYQPCRLNLLRRFN